MTEMRIGLFVATLAFATGVPVAAQDAPPAPLRFEAVSIPPSPPEADQRES